MSDLIKFVAVKPTTLSSSISTSATSFTVSGIYDRADNALTMTDFGSIGFGVLEPGTSREEHFSFTGISSNTISGITRGLAMKAPYTETAGNKKTHSAGTKVILYTNSPAFYDTIANKKNDETIDGEWTFVTRPGLSADGDTTDDKKLVTYGQLARTAIGGGVDADTTHKGISKLSVAPASATNPIAVGDNDPRMLTQDENNAAVGTNGTPSSTNKFVTQTDPRMSFIDFGDGSDGDVVISSPTTLTKDMHYNNLTISADLTTAGFKVFVKGTLTITNTFKIKNNGNNGGNGGAGSAGGAGTAGAAGTAASAGTTITCRAGELGAVGVKSSSNTAGNTGVNGTAATHSVSSTSSTAGGNGGTASGSSQKLGGAGATSTYTSEPPMASSAMTLFEKALGSITPYQISASGGSGASGGIYGGGTGTPASGGGGGSGSHGGCVFVVARTIVNNSVTAFLQSKGGNGGNAGAGFTDGSSNAAGSGGGAGGNGGWIFICYSTITGSLLTDVTGGTGGSKSSPTAGGAGGVFDDATNGADGNSGVVTSFII